MLQKPPSISPGLTRRKLDLLSESITSDKSIINSTQENILIEKLFTNQCCQTDFDSVAKNTDLDTSKKVFKPITKPVVKSLTLDCSQRKKIPVLVPKPVKVLKSKEDEKDKPRTDLLKKHSTSSTPRLTKPTTTKNAKAIDNIKKNPVTANSKENNQKLNENKSISNVTKDPEKLHTLKNTKNNCVDHSSNEKGEEKMSQKSNLVKSKRKSIDSVNMVNNATEKVEKLTRSKTSIDIKAPKMSKRGIVKGNDGWETVIRSRRSNPLTQSSSNIKLKSPFDIKKRFQVPSSASSMPALAVVTTSNPEKPEPKTILPDKNDRPIISNAVEFPKKKRKPDKPPVPKNKIIDQMRKEMLKDEIEEQRICDEELLRNRQFFDEEMMLAREIRELENAESSCSDDMTQSDRYSDLLDNMILTERMYTINEIKALIQYGNESAIDSIAMPSWDICRSTESIKQTYSARQAKAHQKRQQLLQDKSTKVRELLKKVMFIFKKNY